MDIIHRLTARVFAALLLSTLLLGTLLLGTQPAFADLPCHEGGDVATSSGGAARVVATAWGCRAYPTATYTVERRGGASYVVSGLTSHTSLHISETGRTVVLLNDDHPRADQTVLTAFRDGRSMGDFTFAELLGADHRAVVEGRFVEVRIEGVQLVIADVDGTEYLRTYIGVLRFR